MKTTDTGWTLFKKILTNDDILVYAKNIGELRKKIDEAEAAKNTLKELQREMTNYTKVLEKGEISQHYNATYSFHDPIENFVTITPPPHAKEYEPIVREMTPFEIEKYCQHTLEFEEPEEEESIDDVAATVLDQIDYENYDPGTFVPDDEVESLTMRRTLRPLIPEGVRPNFVTCDENRFYREYYIKSLPTPNRPFVLWMYKLNSIGRVIESKGLAWGNEDELKAKLNIIMQKAGVNIGVLLREQTNLGIQITTENEELQEQEEAILNVDRDQVDVFWSAKNNNYFILDDFGERLYLTIERRSQSQIYFQDPAVPKGTILKNKKDIQLVDRSKNSQEEPEEEEEKLTGMVEKEWPDEAEIPSETISEIKPYYIEKDDHYYVVKTFNKSFPWVLWKRVYKGNKIVETNGVFYGTSREEIIMKLEGIKLIRSLETEAHLLNSTGNYDMIENEDGSVSARIKEESDR